MRMNPEAQLMSKVMWEIMQADDLIFAHHCRDTRTCLGRRGWPDLVLLGPGGVEFWELKSDNGRMSREQQEFQKLCRAAGVPYRVITPGSVSSGHLNACIEDIASLI